MNAPIYISPRVINTLNSLPQSDRMALAGAITSELILGIDASDSLTPMQSLVFAIIRQYVRHDTHKLAEQ